ncbi:hypothetical protein A6R68_09592, partial [Neotoma lepida]
MPSAASAAASFQVPENTPAAAMVNLTMFFDIMADGKPLGHSSFELFADKVPKTAEKDSGSHVVQNWVIKTWLVFGDLKIPRSHYRPAGRPGKVTSQEHSGGNLSLEALEPP